MAARKEQEGEKNRFMLLLARRPTAYHFHLHTEDITKTLNVFFCVWAYSEFLRLVTVHARHGMGILMFWFLTVAQSQINMECFSLVFKTEVLDNTVRFQHSQWTRARCNKDTHPFYYQTNYTTIPLLYHLYVSQISQKKKKNYYTIYYSALYHLFCKCKVCLVICKL